MDAMMERVAQRVTAALHDELKQVHNAYREGRLSLVRRYIEANRRAYEAEQRVYEAERRVRELEERIEEMELDLRVKSSMHTD